MSINIHVNLDINLQSGSSARANFGVLGILAEHSVNGDRINGPYSSLAEAVADGFTSVAEPEIHAALTAAFAQRPRCSLVKVLLRLNPGTAEDVDVALDAIEALDPGFAYMITMISRLDADVEALATWLSTRSKMGIAQSSSAAMLAGTAGNIGETLQDSAFENIALIYHDDDTEFLDVAVAARGLGFRLDAPLGAGSWAYIRITGVPADTLTTAQRLQLLDYDVNYYAPVTYTSGEDEPGFLFKGTVSSGQAIKTRTTLHLTEARMEEAFMNVFLAAAASNQPMIGYDDAGIGRFQAAALSVFGNLVRAGHYVQDAEVNGVLTPVVNVPLASELSAAVKQSGILTMDAAAVIRSAITSVGDAANVGFSINLSFGE